MKITPANCPHCEYDRRFPGFESGGWMQQDNNGPIVSCPMCNDKGIFPFEPYEQEDRERAIALSSDNVGTQRGGS
jgi:hypothetical protein